MSRDAPSWGTWFRTLFQFILRWERIEEVGKKSIARRSSNSRPREASALPLCYNRCPVRVRMLSLKFGHSPPKELLLFHLKSKKKPSRIRTLVLRILKLECSHHVGYFFLQSSAATEGPEFESRAPGFNQNHPLLSQSALAMEMTVWNRIWISLLNICRSQSSTLWIVRFLFQQSLMNWTHIN